MPTAHKRICQFMSAAHEIIGRHKLSLLFFFLTLLCISLLETGIRFAQRNQTDGPKGVMALFWDFHKVMDIVANKGEHDPFEDFIAQSKLPVYNVVVPQESIKHFEKVIQQAEASPDASAFDLNTFQKVFVEHDGVRLQAKFRLHGSVNHWKGRMKSYRLNITEGKLLNKMKKMTFLIPEDRGYLTPLFMSKMAERVEMPYAQNDVAILQINGKFRGVYILEEDIDSNKQFMERSGLINNVTLKGVYGVKYDAKSRPLESSFISVDSQHKEEILNRFDRLLKAADAHDKDELLSLVDIDKAAAFEALRTIQGDHGTHDYQEINLRMAYSTESGRFYFLPRAETPIFKLTTHNVYQADGMPSNFEHNLTYYYAPQPLRIFHALLSIKEFRKLRDDKLRVLLGQNREPQEIIQQLINEKGTWFIANPMTNINPVHVEKEIQLLADTYRGNAELINSVLGDSRIFAAIKKTERMITVELTPDSIANISLRKFQLNVTPGRYSAKLTLPDSSRNPRTRILDATDGVLDLAPLFENVYLMASFDKQLFAVKTKYILDIVKADQNEFEIQDAKLTARNDYSLADISQNNIHIQILRSDDLTSRSSYMDIQSFQEHNSNLKLEIMGKDVVLKRGEYKIDKTTIFPKGYNLKIEPGVKIAMGEGASFVSYSPAQFLGDANNPIEIFPQANSFGVFAFIGEPAKPINFRAKYLKVTGGHEDFINGVFYSGALAIYFADVEMSHSSFSNNFGDDGLNIKHSRVKLENLSFLNNKSDQLDLDLCEGSIVHSTFIHEHRNPNADGIDASSSLLLVKRNKIQGAGDKGVSVGEKAKIVLQENTFERNNIAIAVKDSSQALVYRNIFNSNDLTLASYRKKPIFNGGVVYMSKNQGGGDSYTMENGSLIVDHENTQFDHPITLSNVGSILRKLEVALRNSPGGKNFGK